MSSVDDRIVAMKFDYRQFGAGVAATIGMLQKLKDNLNFTQQQKGLADLSAKSKDFNLGNMSASIDGASTKFLALATIGVTALSKLTSSAIDAGTALTRSLTIAPVSSGFDEYELKLGAIQTIMAGSGENLKTVNRYLNELNTYADRTIYSFADMTQNIGKFTNAGVSLKDSVASIQGVANVAAVSGANAGEASRAMYNFAQALSAGYVKLIDWKSIELANMGTVEFKQQLIDTAVAMGTLEKTTKGYVTKSGSVLTATKGFNEALTDQFLTSKVLTKTLKRYSDQTTDIGKKATAAAQDVKTFSQLIDTLRESAQSGWAETWEIVFGNFDESKSLWTSVNNVFSDMIGNSADARNALLKDWKEIGGRDVLIQGFKNLAEAVDSFITPIREAFREFFPAKTGEDLYVFTQRFRDFMYSLKLGEESMENLKRTFRGVFALFDIGVKIAQGLFGVLGDIFGAAEEGSGGFLEFTGSIGDFIVKVNEALERGEVIPKFFERVSSAILLPIDFLQSLGAGIGDFIDDAKDLLSGFIPQMADSMSSSARPGSFDKLFDVINVSLLAGLALLIRNFIKNASLGEGFIDTIRGSFDALTGSMKAMQTQIQAKTLLMIAGAIALLTVSVIALSLIDPEKLTASLAAMATAFAQLLVAMTILTKFGGVTGIAKIPVIAASMILLAGAVVVLSAAMLILSTLDWEEIGKGLVATAGLLGILIAAALPLSTISGPMVRASASLVILGVALNLIAASMKIFATMDWSELGKGLAAVAGALVGIAVGMTLMPKGMVAQGAALILIATALNILAAAVKSFSDMDWQAIGKGLAAIGGSLLVIAAAMHLMPKGMVLQAAGLLILAAALNGIALALGQMGGMTWEEIAKGLVTLAGSLVIIAAAMKLMTFALPGAAALIVVAGALAVLTPVLLTLGKMSWEEIARGLATLAGAFAIIGIAGLLLTPVIPAMLGLGAAALLVGAGLALAGIGVTAFSVAFSAFMVALSAGVSVINALLGTIIAYLPDAMEALGKSIVAFFKGIADGADALIDALVVILVALLDVIIDATPKIVEAFVVIVVALLDAIVDISPDIGRAILALLELILDTIVAATPKIVKAGVDLLISLLEGIRDAIPRIAKVVTEIILAFLKAWSSEIPKIVDGGIKAMVDFINGMANSIKARSGEIGGAIENLTEAFVQLGKDVVSGFVQGLADSVGLGKVADAAGGLVNAAESGVKIIGKIFSPSKLFKELGRFMTQGFAIGLRETKDVEDALDKLKGLINDTLTEAKADIQEQKAIIADINEKKKAGEGTPKLEKQLKKANEALEAAQKIRQKTAATNKFYRKELQDEQKKLLALSVQYEQISEKLEDANRALEAATNQRDNFEKSISDKFSVLPGIEEDTSLDTYHDAIRKATEDNNKFKATLDQLRSLGLDDRTYEKFLEEGVGSQKFLDDLLAAGKTQIDEIDKITAELDKSAANIGFKASRELYQAGVDAAQGLVDGLEAKQGAISAQMDKIATEMANAIKKKLGIKSPSKVFEEIAKFSMDGLAGGFKKYGDIAEFAVANVGDLAIMSMKDSMRQLGDILPSEIDTNPVIAPVLDLSALERTALTLNDILAPRDVSVNVSYDQASVLALETAASKKAQDEFMEMALVAGDNFQFVQNNTSPKALTTAEIYRQTKNQISVVKGALPK